MIFRQWPMSGAWAVGVLMGVNILMHGWTMIMMGGMVRGMAKAAQAGA